MQQAPLYSHLVTPPQYMRDGYGQLRPRRDEPPKMQHAYYTPQYIGPKPLSKRANAQEAYYRGAYQEVDYPKYPVYPAAKIPSHRYEAQLIETAAQEKPQYTHLQMPMQPHSSQSQPAQMQTPEQDYPEGALRHAVVCEHAQYLPRQNEVKDIEHGEFYTPSKAHSKIGGKRRNPKKMKHKARTDIHLVKNIRTPPMSPPFNCTFRRANTIAEADDLWRSAYAKFDKWIESRLVALNSVIHTEAN